MKVSLPHGLWNGEHTLEADLPPRWDVDVLSMEGDRARPIGREEYRAAIMPLVPLMKGAKEVCVLFDDLSRPTRTYEIAPTLLEAFANAGIKDPQVRFLCALGTHSPHNNADFRKKLGSEVLNRFPVYNHNCYENCETLGRTALGTPVTINKEYLGCDLRIGIGSFIPHQFCGFGGGYKIVFPGIAHIDAIEYHHGLLLQQNMENCWGLGNHSCNAILSDMRESGRMARLDIKIDVFVNSSSRATRVFAGHPDSLYPAMIEGALTHYATKTSGEYDIIFANTFGKANEAVIAASTSEAILSRNGGCLVILNDIEEGQVIHYLMGRFGKNLWGRLGRGERPIHKRVRRLFLYSRHRDHAGSYWFGKKEDIIWVDDLSALIDELDREYAGRPVRAAVIPDGTVQMIEEDSVKF
jgi:nickel-dependent lactate racemase